MELGIEKEVRQVNNLLFYTHTLKLVMFPVVSAPTLSNAKTVESECCCPLFVGAVV